MREAFGCGVYPGPDQQRRSNKTDYGNAVWQRFCHPSLWRVASRKKRQQQRQIRTTANASKLRQGDHAPGVDGKLLTELLGLRLPMPPYAQQQVTKLAEHGRGKLWEEERESSKSNDPK